MSESTTIADPVEPQDTKKPQYYRFSVLITAIGRLFRSFVVLLVVIVANAVVQAALIAIFQPVPGVSLTFILTLLISLAFLVWGFYCFNLVALEGATGKPSVKSIFSPTAGQWAWFILWAAILYVIVVAGLIIDPYLAIAALVLLPFVSLAAADGNRNPIVTNFKVMWQRILRYLSVAIIFTPIVILSLLFTSINGFFIGHALGSFITWIFWGVLGAWYLNALGLIYRSTYAGSIESDTPEPAPQSTSDDQAQLGNDASA